MITDTELKINGFKALNDTLGDVEMERFIVLLQKEPFDYTKWQKQLWSGLSIQQISKMAHKLKI